MAAKRSREIHVTKVMDVGVDPSYVGLAHRHFEKSLPTGAKIRDGVAYNAPVDLIGMALPPDLVAEIDEVTLVYAKRG